MFLKLCIKIVSIIFLLQALKICPEDKNILLMPLNQDFVNGQLEDTVVVNRDITIGEYFQFLDSIIKKYNTLTSYNLTEHLLVRANPWIIDTLQNTDYYRMKARDSFVYDQKKMIVLRKGTSLVLPDLNMAKKINESFQKTTIDVNIPEFKLRIWEKSILLYEFPIRVGRNESKYLEMAGRTVDLRTIHGKGKIVAHVKNPSYFNPVNNHQYFVTTRDDYKVTKLPQIPFIETEINGIRNGQLIHPTTNPVTLGKAYSNGCIGTNEADAWVIYYNAPLGTYVKIRYSLKSSNENGKEIIWKDIYNYKKDF